MPRKKKADLKLVTKTEETVSEPTSDIQPIKKDKGLLSLTEVELARLARFESEIRRYYAEFSLKQQEKAIYIKSIDPENRIQKYDAELQMLASASHAARQKYNESRMQVGERLGINMDEYSYDDNDGRLHLQKRDLDNKNEPTKTS